MNFHLLGIAVALLTASLSMAQVTIQNPQHLDVPEQRVQMLHHIICRVVAEEFHGRGGKSDGPVTLNLGRSEGARRCR
jgi:hypothetical protein